MPHRPRLRPLRRIDAFVVAAVGVAEILAASRLIYVKDTTVQPWHVLWPVLFAAGGVTSLWLSYCAVVPKARRMTSALAWSGALNITAYMSRALILLVTAHHNQTEIQTAKLQLGVVIYFLLAVVTGYIWLHVLRPGVEMSKYQPPET